MKESVSKAWLRTLDDIEGTDLPLVGGKAFRLAMLRQNGLNVPPGLVLTTTFFETQLKNSKLTPLWMGSPDIAVTSEALSWLADSLKTKPIGKELSTALEVALTALFGNRVASFAVRSSAIDEDQRDHTFAGIHLTELGVPRPALPIAITRCWASALSNTALEYRQVHGMSLQGIRIAVLIQPMLRPTSSGVGFTVNPLTGSRAEMIIEATWGLGEVLVSGAVQPYLYKLANQPPDYPVLEQQAGSVPPPAHLNETTPLSPPELTALALQFERIQALLGEAQDVEWAKQDDTFFILQTRPVALPPPSPQRLDPEWTRGSHPEYLPELPSPFFSSLLLSSQKGAITFFRDLGLAVDDLGPYLKLILGRPYLNLTFLKRVISQVGIAPGKLLYTIGHTGLGGGGGLSIDWGLAFQTRRVYGAVIKRLFTSAAGLKQYEALVAEAVAIFDQPDLEAEPATILSQFRQHQRIYEELFNVNLGLASVLSAATAFGSSLLAPLTANPATLLTALAQRQVKTREGSLNEHLTVLGHLARNDPPTRHYLVEAAPDFTDYEQNPAISAEFRAEFAEMLAKFGEWAIYEADTGWPRYAENPASLLRITRQYALSPESHDAPPRPPLDWSTLTEQATGLNRLIPWRRWLAGSFVGIMRRFLVLRDESNQARATVMAAARRWDLALGQTWVERGWLAAPTDIFWLTIEELEQVIMAGESIGLKLSVIVQARQATYQGYAETPMPFNLQESQIFSIELGQGLVEEMTADVVVGLPISPGHIRGTIKVLHSPDDFQPGQEGIILVMPTTDPAWLPLLHSAAGLIVETGGLLSHGSIIAREYGVPGVANIPHATKHFHDGEVVLLDGSTGVVQRLERVDEGEMR